MGQKFFALTSAARRVAFECDFDLSFAASRDKSPRLLSKRVEKREGETERGEDGSTSFSSTSTCTCVSISAAQVPSRQGSSSSISRRLAPTCRRSLVSCLPLSISLTLSLSLTLFAASWRRAQAHFEVYEAAAAAAAMAAAAARGI